jgi:uncharacterized protein (TIGR04255 family)
MALIKNIDPCPIQEAVVEIRFSSTFPSEAIFGMVYASIRKIFQDSATHKLPVSEIPESIRSLDENFKYQAHHQIHKDNLQISIGPRVIVFSNVSPYIGWSKWFVFIENVLSLIKDTSVVEHVERVGLRYVNIFDDPILDKINLNISVDGRHLLSESTSLRTELVDSDLLMVLQVSNSVSIVLPGGIKKDCSIIDIDCVRNVNISGGEFFDLYKDLVNGAHDKEKELFFRLLKKSFISDLNPEY